MATRSGDGCPRTSAGWTAEPPGGRSGEAGHTQREGTRKRSVKQERLLLMRLQLTCTPHAPASRRASWEQGRPPAQGSALQEPLRPPPGCLGPPLRLHRRGGGLPQPPPAQRPFPGMQCRAEPHQGMRGGVRTRAPRCCNSPSLPARNQSAIPHVSPEARTMQTFMRTYTQPSQLFPKKGLSLQENSSN